MTVRRNLAVLALSAATAVLAGCHGSGSAGEPGNGPTAHGPKEGSHGPMFPQCGGVSDETVTQLTQVAGLIGTAKNSVGCQWLLHGGIRGPHFSFSWYRGSPIGRERKTEELTRPRVEDITIDGHSGFIAIGADTAADDSLCEIGIQFADDFFEWSISFAQKPYPNPCDVARELSRQTIANSK